VIKKFQGRYESTIRIKNAQEFFTNRKVTAYNDENAPKT
jgi:hypothetical protein